MPQLSTDELIEKAASVTHPVKNKKSSFATVGCALVTTKGNIYLGVCIDVCCGMGFCAEHSAVAAMITAGEYHITKIVAVTAAGQVIAPCGRCREFMFQINEGNLDTQVILSKDRMLTLRELLPNINSF